MNNIYLISILASVILFSGFIIALVLISIKIFSKPFQPIINDFTNNVFDLINNPSKPKDYILLFLSEPAKNNIINYINKSSNTDKKYIIESIKIIKLQSNLSYIKISANVYMKIITNQETIYTKNIFDYILEKNTQSKYKYLISKFNCKKTKIIHNKKTDPYH